MHITLLAAIRAEAVIYLYIDRLCKLVKIGLGTGLHQRALLSILYNESIVGP
jgi:hypothetical protein